VTWRIERVEEGKADARNQYLRETATTKDHAIGYDCYQECCALAAEVGNDIAKEVCSKLEGEDAQSMVDFLDQVIVMFLYTVLGLTVHGWQLLHDQNSGLSEKQKKGALRLLTQLLGLFLLIPKSLQLSNVRWSHQLVAQNRHDMSYIFRGEYEGQFVHIKAVHIYRKPQDQANIQVGQQLHVSRTYQVRKLNMPRASLTDLLCY
jgi:hypothetical protein